MYNCPNCGAPIVGDKCEYCGTIFRIAQKETSAHIIQKSRSHSALENHKIEEDIMRVLVIHTGVTTIKPLFRKSYEQIDSLDCRGIADYLVEEISIQKLSCLLKKMEYDGRIQRIIKNGKVHYYAKYY